MTELQTTHHQHVKRFLATFKERARNKQLEPHDMIVYNIVKNKPVLNGFVAVKNANKKIVHGASGDRCITTYPLYLLLTKYHHTGTQYANGERRSGIAAFLVDRYAPFPRVLHHGLGQHSRTSLDDTQDQQYKAWLINVLAAFYEQIEANLQSPLWIPHIPEWYGILRSTPPSELPYAHLPDLSPLKR